MTTTTMSTSTSGETYVFSAALRDRSATSRSTSTYM